MKAVILNGMEAGDNLTKSVHDMLFGALRARGWEVEPFILHEMEIAFCAGCFGCWVRTPGRCVLQDGGHTVTRAFIQSDLAVFLTPVTFGGYSSQLKKAVDHLLPNILPFFRAVKGETHHQKRYAHYPNLLVLGTLPHANDESERIFISLAEHNAINMNSRNYAAGIITQAQSDETKHQIIENLLAQMEMSR
ncbi:MAG: NAD(P)H-dependent oxidoreductase [Anaerolineae bacterium]|jgi:multimeric flavodoxin WrbA|nr:NAD(P)H-dependent oxidoreductase [Anaerolineae bacterium]MDH7474889.1 NAD(P)H-dependent oxidoreductase [Anaerolineae bacterium]